MRPLNKSERKILTLLEQDCRLSARKLAKSTRLSTEGVIKIINRLVKGKIIFRFNTKINYTRMGYSLHPVHIKLNKLDKTIVSKIDAIIKRYKCCAWHVFSEGEYDLLLSMKILHESDKLAMEKLLFELSPYISEKDVSTVTSAFAISKSFLDEDLQRKLSAIIDFDYPAIELDKKDYELVDLLKENSRAPIIDLAGKLNISSGDVIYRIKKLKQKRVITAFKTRLNMSILGYQPGAALIKFGAYDDSEYRRFIAYCLQKKPIHYFIRQIGTYDVHIDFFVKDITEFYDLIDDIRNRFQFISKITTLVIKRYD